MPKIVVFDQTINNSVNFRNFLIKCCTVVADCIQIVAAAAAAAVAVAAVVVVV